MFRFILKRFIIKEPLFEEWSLVLRSKHLFVVLIMLQNNEIATQLFAVSYFWDPIEVLGLLERPDGRCRRLVKKQLEILNFKLLRDASGEFCWPHGWLSRTILMRFALVYVDFQYTTTHFVNIFIFSFFDEQNQENTHRFSSKARWFRSSDVWNVSGVVGAAAPPDPPA